MVESTCEALSDLVKCEGLFVDKLNCAVKIILNFTIYPIN